MTIIFKHFGGDDGGDMFNTHRCADLGYVICVAEHCNEFADCSVKLRDIKARSNQTLVHRHMFTAMPGFLLNKCRNLSIKRFGYASLKWHETADHECLTVWEDRRKRIEKGRCEWITAYPVAFSHIKFGCAPCADVDRLTGRQIGFGQKILVKVFVGTHSQNLAQAVK